MFNHRLPVGRLPALAAAAIVVVAVGTLAACTEMGSPGPTEVATVESELAPVFARSADARENWKLKRGLAILRRATARYHRIEAALADGYVPARNPVTGELLGCVANPLEEGEGVLGAPYVNPVNIFDGELNLREPAGLFYAPQKNGKLRLAGVEIAIPIAAWDKESPPILFGHELHANKAFGLYGIHVWLWVHNPEGMFAEAHPRISCEFAEESRNKELG